MRPSPRVERGVLGGLGSSEATSSGRLGMMRTLSALPMLPKGTTSALNFAATRTKSVLSGQRRRYLSVAPWHASREPPGNSKTGSPRCRSLKMFLGDTGTAPHFAKPPPAPKFSPTPTPPLCFSSPSSLRDPLSSFPSGLLARGLDSLSSWSNACTPSSDARAAARSSKGSPTKSKSSGGAGAGGVCSKKAARVSGKLTGWARPRGA
mmetsp:Transcript_21696/g.61498  ORF Transcript_21696/g.61498 Transcript_21696/m.61498 type:complete len:207 (-) Transcript_21696:1500-2120(-)